MERRLAFNLSRNFLKERYHQALHLPMSLRQDHHSGATINRIRSGSVGVMLGLLTVSGPLISATLFDSLSNILTVITLRLERA